MAHGNSWMFCPSPSLSPPDPPTECPNEMNVDGELVRCDCQLEENGDSYRCPECGWEPPEPDYSGC